MDRHMRPVYLDKDLLGKAFRRTHTGGRQCSEEEVFTMIREASTKSEDAEIARTASVGELDWDTITRYRRHFDSENENHVWADMDDAPAHAALRESLANCLTNADWHERRGVVCVWRSDAFAIANPGGFRMPIEEARKPGSSDPRNEALLRMFSMIDVGERAGSGMDEIFNGWAWAGYGEPTYAMERNPDRTTLTLPLKEESDNYRQIDHQILSRVKWTCEQGEQRRTSKR